MRWLTLHPIDQPDFEIVLMLPSNQQEKALIGKQNANKPLCVFQTKNCQKTFETLKDRGVEFIEEPKKEPWGTGALFKDIYGNVLYLVQPA